MTLPSADTPLYNHPLPDIEQWLISQGCHQDSLDIHCWHIEQLNWKAELWLDVDSLNVRYIRAGEDGQDIQRSFKYSLSRRDLDEAIFTGP
ncbi:DUF3143 domain-containing protein [Oculatella sp. FACHB-28]|uniref:DUF3143 domain-containing protein n=1 Tax=Cyanophyceae TaxID=3028117 RepID=UPI001688A3C4|nr:MULTISPECIES: DUF3143 domain-containing protein [Cyanophyceae]MBD1871095.1 DUF3143 domain-containing protein [Cyanobacteria bacterium FACHB-471]MBD1995701.1 DUF3143 domain-containing protein [Leptolyngbya sp. FACHB-541]MBD2055918.1 DUF3143 domain-containing protein [Oculatella sp. FACHB-28]MBD2069223.1 DUF3143 domain-containing protein [Leptolyngbya sp. FACHB-671]